MSNKTITQAHDEINDQQLNDVVGGVTLLTTSTAYKAPTSTSLSLSSQTLLKSTSLI